MKQDILDETYDYLGKFVWLSNDHARVAATAWVAHTHLTRAFEEEKYPTPRLTILSPEKRSGKTRLLEIIRLLVQNPEAIVSPSPSSLYGMIHGSEVIPTLLIDEIGRTLEKKEISDFISIIEAGFQPGQVVSRSLMKKGEERQVERLKIYAPILMAGIDNGRMPDTITDRSINIRMKRKTGKRLSYRPRKDAPEGRALAERLAQWASDASDRVKDAEIRMPEKLNDREQDKWEPLAIVGWLADGTEDTANTSGTTFQRGIWEERIIQAALALSKDDKETDTVTKGELLLQDIYNILEHGPFEIKTGKLVDALNSIEEAPWSTFNYGKPLNDMGLARLLKPYIIKSTNIRFDDGTRLKGYHRASFEDAWDRYLGIPPGKPVPVVFDVQPVQEIGKQLDVSANAANENEKPSSGFKKLTKEMLDKLIADNPGCTYEEYQEKRKELIQTLA
jgi:Protein of unknown function (DUF3631)